MHINALFYGYDSLEILDTWENIYHKIIKTLCMQRFSNKKKKQHKKHH
jgi:hypothetical protein